MLFHSLILKREYTLKKASLPFQQRSLWRCYQSVRLRRPHLRALLWFFSRSSSGGNKKGGRKGRKRPWPTTTVQVDMDVGATDSGRASARRAQAPALITSASKLCKIYKGGITTGWRNQPYIEEHFDKMRSVTGLSNPQGAGAILQFYNIWLASLFTIHFVT